MGVIRVEDYIKIERSKIWLLQYKRQNSSFNWETIGYFSSKERAINYVRKLVEDGTYVEFVIDKNRNGDNIYGYLHPESNVLFRFALEYHEVDLEPNEVSYYGHCPWPGIGQKDKEES